VFMTDHGEYAGAHNYMMEKWHTAYQEAIHVPVVVQSAAINPDTEMRQIDALTSHVDILPTLLGLAGVTEQEPAHARIKLQADHTMYPLPGVNLTPLIQGIRAVPTEPDGMPREGVLFITDDEITQPLQDGGKYQVSNDEAYGVFVQAVEVFARRYRPGAKFAAGRGASARAGAPTQSCALCTYAGMEVVALLGSEPQGGR